MITMKAGRNCNNVVVISEMKVLSSSDATDIPLAVNNSRYVLPTDSIAESRIFSSDIIFVSFKFPMKLKTYMAVKIAIVFNGCILMLYPIPKVKPQSTEGRSEVNVKDRLPVKTIEIIKITATAAPT